MSTSSPEPTLLKLKEHLFIAYKWVLVAPFLALSTLCLGLLTMLFCTAGFPNFASRLFATTWARSNAAMSMMQVKVLGTEKIDRTQSYIIVANHQSLADIYVLYGFLGMDIKWVMKKELKTVPILGIAAEMMGHIFIDRSKTKEALATLNQAKQRIKHGVSVIFFPEGTRSYNGELKQFKKGAFRFALELGLPILPVIIKGTKDILPLGTLDLAPGQVTLEFLQPIATATPSAVNVTCLSRSTRASMQSALNP